MIIIQKLLTGTPAPLSHEPSVVTAIRRSEVDELRVFMDHIAGDEVANKQHHGGLARVLHHYPGEHYAFWKSCYPDKQFPLGSFGENLTTRGILEQDICIGDVFRIGTVLCSVTEPRKPCFTLNHYFQVPGFARVVQNELRTGWFYKILEPGVVRLGDAIALQERSYPELNVRDCVEALLVEFRRDVLERMSVNPSLSSNWRGPAQEALVTGVLPDGSRRLGEL